MHVTTSVEEEEVLPAQIKILVFRSECIRIHCIVYVNDDREPGICQSGMVISQTDDTISIHVSKFFIVIDDPVRRKRYSSPLTDSIQSFFFNTVPFFPVRTC
jgi:hypothetical protein